MTSTGTVLLYKVPGKLSFGVRLLCLNSNLYLYRSVQCRTVYSLQLLRKDCFYKIVTMCQTV